MQSHEENQEQVFVETRKKLAKGIKNAEAKRELPQEAVVVTITNSIVFWGDELERKRFRRKWIEQQASGMKGQMKWQLQKLGKTASVREIDGGKGEVWNIWDTAEVHMTETARQRVEANASEEALKTQEETRKQIKEMEQGNLHPQEESMPRARPEANSQDDGKKRK